MASVLSKTIRRDFMKPENISVFPMGEKNEAFAQYFVGQSYLNMLSTERVTR